MLRIVKQVEHRDSYAALEHSQLFVLVIDPLINLNAHEQKQHAKQHKYEFQHAQRKMNYYSI